MRLHEIVASDAYKRFGDAYLPNDILGFVYELTRVAKLPKSSIPREAVLSAAVQNYVGEVENGGHNQFVGNLWWNAELRDEIRAGLDLIGLTEIAAIYSDLEAYASSDPGRFHNADWTDPIMQGLDDRMNPLLEETYKRHAIWLSSLPNLRIVPEADYPAVRRDIIHRLRGGSPAL